jgi:hypothetical protein
VLSDVVAREQKLGRIGVMDDILSSCRGRDLLRITKELEGGLGSGSRRSRKGRAVKTVFKEDKIKAFKRSLEEIKTTLLLA